MTRVKLPNGDMIEDRRNGNGITYKWLVGILVVVVIGGGSHWLTSVYASVVDQSVRIFNNSDRISRLEVMITGIENQLDRIDRNVEKLVDQK